MHVDQKQLVRRDTLLALIFSPEDRPSIRAFEQWKAKRLVPFVKLGGLCYYDPAAVRAALAKLTVNARA